MRRRRGCKGGHRCGYVRVPPTHKFHGKGYYEEGSTDAIEVHGGLTFAQIEPCAHEDGQGWWFGFDCAHAGDEVYDPSNPPEWRAKLDLKYPEYARLKDHYWTQPEVEEETNRLADQLARLA